MCKKMVLTQHQLEHLTKNIGSEWKEVAIRLQILPAEIAKIELDHQWNTNGAILYMLKTWSARQMHKQLWHLKTLAEALRTSGRSDLASLVLRWERELR